MIFFEYVLLKFMFYLVLKLKNTLKWKARLNFDQGIEKTICWYLDNKTYFSKLKRKDIVARIGLNK